MSLYKNYFGISEDTALPDDKDAIIGQLREQDGKQELLPTEAMSREIQSLKAKLRNANDKLSRSKTKLAAAAETIRQMTELLRNYESSHDHLRQKCSICIKAGELLKEPA